MTATWIERHPGPPEGSAELAMLLSTAVRIEPQLIRAARLTLLPHLDVGAEADLWFSSWVAFHEADAIMLRPEATEHLREGLAERLAADTAGTDPARGAGALIARVHAGQSRAVLLEERLAWLSLQPEPADLDRELMPVLRGAVASADVAEWFVRAWPRLPEAVRQTMTAWKIAQVARARLPGAPSLAAEGVPGIVLADVAQIAQMVDDVPLAVRHDGSDLVLGVAAGDADTLPVPDTDPRILDVTWQGRDGGQSRTVYVPAGGSLTLPVEPAELVLRTARGVLYAVGRAPFGPRVHIPYVFDNPEHHRSVFACWRLLRAAGIDVTVGDGNSWAGTQLAEAEYVLVVGRAEDLFQRHRRERVVAVRLPGSTEAYYPGLRTIDVPELTESGVRPLVNLLRGVVPPAPTRTAESAPGHGTPSREGEIVTFYSYDGGTDRTMALANVAWILAANGYRVLAVDFDLDSPGLHRYFRPFIDQHKLDAAGSVTQLIRRFEWETARNVPRDDGWYREYARADQYTFSLNWSHFPPGGSIDFLAAGHPDGDYAPRAELNWGDFYDRLGGGLLLDALRGDMKSHFDYTLINSGAGLTDVAGICTEQLPDLLVECFTFTEQSMNGAANVAANVTRLQRRHPIRILPVPTRVDAAEKVRVEAGRLAARQRFAALPSGLSDQERDRYWAAVEIPYVPYYAYEETLATFADQPGGRFTMLAAYEALTAYITDGAVTGLPPIDEPLRQATTAHFARQGVVAETLVTLRYTPEDGHWAEWITKVLQLAGVTVNPAPIGPDDGGPAPEGRELVVVSPAAEQLGTAGRTPLAVYVADMIPLPGTFRSNSAFLAGQPEGTAVSRLLNLVGHAADGFDLGRIGLRFPGRPNRIFRVPSRNVRFTGREDTIALLRSQLNGAAGPVVLSQVLPVTLQGMGGIGKTQIAIEYAHRFRNAYDVVWWITADPTNFIDAQLADLGGELGLTTTGTAADQGRETLAALYRGDFGTDWLLIFDNADDIETVTRLLPDEPRGHILITSRNLQWNDSARAVPIDTFAREESIAHLQIRLPSILPEEANRVAETLGDLPIAVAAAGAWLADTGTPVDEYLRQIEQQNPGGGVEPMWELSLQRLQDRSPAAYRLLQLCSMLAPEVGLDLISSDQMADLLTPYDPQVAERLYRGRLVQEINRLALLKLDSGARTIQVHRLLQQVVRQRMSDVERAEAQRQVHLVLAGARPIGDVDDPATWPRFAIIWPHLDAAEVWRSWVESVRGLVIDRVHYLWLFGRGADAHRVGAESADHWQRMREASAEMLEQIPLTRQLLQLQCHVADTLRDRADFTASLRLDEQVFDEQRRLLGEHHPHTLITATGLGSDLRALGRYAEALELDQRTCANWIEQYGEDDPHTLNALNHLAISLRLTGAVRPARARSRQVFDRATLVAGERHTLTLTAGSNLGRDLRETGEYAASVTLLREILSRHRDVYGGDSPRTSAAMVNLAVSERSAGRAAEAGPRLEQAYENLLERLGPTSPEALACRLSRAVNLLAVGDPTAAGIELDELGRHYRDHLGDTHPLSVICVNNRAVVLRATGDLITAHTLAMHAAQAFEDVVGPRHPYTLAALTNVAILAAERGDLDEALQLLERLADAANSTLGPEHPDAIRIAANLALVRHPDEDADLQARRLSAVVGAGHPAVEALRDRRYLHRTLDPHPF